MVLLSSWYGLFGLVVLEELELLVVVKVFVCEVCILSYKVLSIGWLVVGAVGCFFFQEVFNHIGAFFWDFVLSCLVVVFGCCWFLLCNEIVW